MADEAPRSVSRSRSLATRSFLAVAAVFLLVAAGLLAASVLRDSADRREALGDHARSKAAFVAAVSPEAVFSRDFLTLETLVRVAGQDDESAVHMVILDGQGEPMTRFVDRGDDDVAAAIEQAGSEDSSLVADALAVRDHINEVRTPVISEGVLLGEVRLLYSLDSANAAATRYGIEAAVVAGVLTVLTLVTVLVIFRRKVRDPLAELTEATNALAAGDFSRGFDESKRDDEIGVLQRAFTNMSDELSVTLAGLEVARDDAEAAARAKSEFLANMSHEVRTPLNALLGLTELLLDSDPTPEQQDMLMTMHNSGDALLGVLNEILDYSKLDSGHFEFDNEPFSPADLLISATELFGAAAGQKGIKLHTELARDVPTVVSGDRGRVRQVLLNLVGNAVKFTEEGSVRVSVTTAGNGCLRFSVTDTGIGIDEARVSQLFEPFRQGDTTTTRRFGGTGLGLAISNKLVQAMGGELSATGTPGVGSTFSFDLPLETSDFDIEATFVSESFGGPVDDTMGDRHPLRILLAEDNPVNQMVAGRMLGRLGYRITTADNGVQAVAEATGATYDLVLMDISMPGLDGLQATEQIRAALPASEWPRIVAFTAHALEGDREYYLRSGMDGYLTKPIRLDDLVTVLRETARLPIGDAPASTPHAETGAATHDAEMGAEMAGSDFEPMIDMTERPSEPAQIARAGANDDANAPVDPFDREALVAMFGDDPEPMLNTLVPVFLGDAELQLDAMRTGLADGDDEAVRKGAHSLKGASASMALPAISEACLALEVAIKQEQRDGLPALIDAVAARVDELSASFESRQSPS